MAVTLQTSLVILFATIHLSQGGYVITIETSTLDYADSNTTAYIWLIGHLGRSSRLRISPGPRGFYKGSVVFTNVSDDYGELHQVTIESANTGDQPAWKLNKVEIFNDVSKTNWVKNCRGSLECWLEKSTLSIDFKITVDGEWEWSEWSSCSVSCGPDGVRSRAGTCTGPPPRNGGHWCRGPRLNASVCNRHPCPSTSTTMSALEVTTNEATISALEVTTSETTMSPLEVTTNETTTSALEVAPNETQFASPGIPVNHVKGPWINQALISPNMTLTECLALLIPLLEDSAQNRSLSKVRNATGRVTPIRPVPKRPPAEAAAAASIGSVALIAMICFIGGIVLLDSSNLVNQTLLLKRNVFYLCGIQQKSRKRGRSRIQCERSCRV